DAYISFQYARNLATGAGFVFNPGERVLGTTSPLETLLLASVYRLFGDVLAPAAIWIGALALAFQAAVLYGLCGDSARGLGVALALSTWLGAFGAHGWLALETNLLTALVLATLWSVQRGWDVLGGVLLGLAFLCRYDAALLIPIVVAERWWDRRTLPVRILLVSLA